MYELYNDDCFKIFPKLEKDIIEKKMDKIDLICVDLPYGLTSIDWDVRIDLNKMWKALKPICKESCTYIFFCTTKFGYELINSKKDWFRYDLVWQKNTHVGFLSCNVAPLRQHEMIYIFSKTKSDDVDRVCNLELREYSKIIFNKIGKTLKEIHNKIGNTRISHFFYNKGMKFSIPTKPNYEKLNELYQLSEFEEYLTYDEMNAKFDTFKNRTYNPQMTGNELQKVKIDYTSPGEIYGKSKKGKIPPTNSIQKGRFPNSILKYSKDTVKKGINSTAKPIQLLKFLIKTYSNEGDLVMDFTCGSNSCGRGAKECNRQYIGIEKDKKQFEQWFV